MDRPCLAPELVHDLHVPRRAALMRLVFFVFLYAATAGITFECVSRAHAGVWVFVACLPLYVLAAASLHGISLFTHEAVHGTLARNQAVNHALGAICACPVLQNYAAYKVLHLRHHNHLGCEGDPDHYHNYTRWTWMLFAMYWGRLIAGYPAYIVMIPILAWRQGTARDRLWIGFEVLCVSALVSAAVVLPLPRGLLLHAWLIPMLLINTLVNIRGMSQHTLLEHCDDPILGTRSILTNRLTAFFMCNENYHLEHHLYPGVPWYNLPRLHRALHDDLAARGAPYIGSYFEFVREFVIGSFRRSPLGSSPGRP